MKNLGLIRVGAAVPDLKVANTKYNTEQIISLICQAEEKQTGFLLFPELAITGSSCGDLFYQEHLYENQLAGLQEICRATEDKKLTVILGFYLRVMSRFYTCAALIQKGEIKGIVPKIFPSATGGNSESRWFTGGSKLAGKQQSISLFGKDVPFGRILFTDESTGLSVGAEPGEDFTMPLSPGAHLALNGAHIIFIPAAENELVGKAAYRRQLLETESAKNCCGYVYASAGACESTTDTVCGGHSLIAENGVILKEGPRFSRESTISYSEIDFHRIRFDRCKDPVREQCRAAFGSEECFTAVGLEPVLHVNTIQTLFRSWGKNPFILEDDRQMNARCQEIFDIQSAGLAKRILHSRSGKSVVGISGGLDSTLALLVTAHTHRLIGKPAKDIIAVTMPGFGTTGKTYNNALTMMKLLGTDVREISIKEAVNQHFRDIDHDPSVHDVTYENSQARERTQILMDIANRDGGMVIGTGDLSEMALGWCTYNGDHMSMYSVNAGVPKTLVRFVVKWIMENRLSDSAETSCFSADDPLLKQTLQDILDTPISPELLPPDPNGDIAQKTEESVGPYILHDFFIYYTVRWGMEPEKLLFTAKNAFAGEYDEEFIKKWLKVFYRRFFNQQFKRSCVPDGPKVGSVGLSPRGDWHMPSDADASIWLSTL